MGTNYYLHTDVCAHCNRERERIHVGKSSSGWPFLFRGYSKWPPDGVPHPITSALGWRQYIEQAIAKGAVLLDEYGQRQEAAEFWEFVEGKQGDTRGPNATPNYQHGVRASEWTDSEGYRFCDNEFS